MAQRPHFVDTTLFFTPTSGGVRRYLLAKHDWLARHAAVRHTLLVPGPVDTGARGGVVEFASPLVPFGAGYRCPLRCRAFRRQLLALEPDLVEAADPYQVGWLAAAVARERGVPSVAFCHSDLISLVARRLGPLAGHAAGSYLRLLYGRFDRVLAPSRVMADQLLAAGVPGAHVQPLGVDADTFAPARADPSLRASLRLDPGTRLLVFAGRLAPEKNLPDLYAAVASLGDPYHLLVIGGPTRRRAAERVTVIPYQRDPQRLAAWLATCDALLHAGRCETFGLVALEALSCGLPVVAYAAGALPELVDESVGALAPPGGGAPALADAVRRLFARDPAVVRATARRRVLEHHTWDRVLAQQLRTYAALLERPTLFVAGPAHGAA